MLKRLAAHPLALIIFWSLLVHVPGITSPLLDYHAHRQCQTASMARNYVRHGMHFFCPEVDNFGLPQRAGTEFPIYSYLLALLYKAFGVHELLGRILSALFAAWGAAYLFFFVRQRLPETVALGAALIMCVIPVHLYFTRTVQPEAMALWGFLAFLFHLDRYARKKKAADAIAAVLFGALPCLLKLSFVYLIGGMLALFIFDNREEEGLAFGTGCLIFFSIMIITGAWYLYAKTAAIKVLPLGGREQWKNLRPFFTLHLWLTHIVSRLPEIYATYPGLLLASVGAWFLYRRNQLHFWGSWFLITLLYEGFLGAYGLQHKYTAIPFAPIVGVLAACGARALWTRRMRWHCPRWVVSVLLIGIPFHAALRIAHWYTLERLWLFDARAKLAALSSNPNDLVLTNTVEHPVLLYYLDHYGYALAVEKMKPQKLAYLLRYNVRYFVTPRTAAWEAHPEWHAFFARRSMRIISEPSYMIYVLKPMAKSSQEWPEWKELSAP